MTSNCPHELFTLCERLELTFTDTDLLRQALTHTSYANEHKGDNVVHNERLEFLGDAILDMVVGEYLFRACPDMPEGELTKARASVVCEPTLARKARAAGIGDYLLLGRGEAASGGNQRDSILADAFEAVIGAIYLDGGFEAARRFIVRQLQADLVEVQQGNYAKDYKTLLQELVQQQGDAKIIYEVTGETGPDHNKLFQVTVTVNNKRLGHGDGKSKKEAEQNAAKWALEQLDKRHK